MQRSQWLVLVSGLVFSSLGCAWSNSFSVVNHFNKAIAVTIAAHDGAAHNVSADSRCGSGLNQVSVAAGATCQFTLTDSGKLNPGHDGNVQIYDTNNQLACSVKYYYRLVPSEMKGYIAKHSLQLTPLDCGGSVLGMQNLNLISSANKAAVRSLSEKFFSAGDLGKSAQSLARADCNGSDNCVVVSPAASQVVVANGSNLQQSLAVQSRLAHYEILNHEQFLGTHNSMISPAYTDSKDPLDLSYSDPDNFSSLAEQLNMGVRQIEFDIRYQDGVVVLCHNHTTVLPGKLTCSGHASMQQAIVELKDWLASHPHDLVMLYLDTNEAFGAHWQEIDKDFSQIDSIIYTPTMAKIDYQQRTGALLPDNTLPASSISASDILSQGKQVLLVSDEDYNDLKHSRYIFLYANQNPQAELLYEHSVDDYINAHFLCDGPQKYAFIKQL